MWTVSSLDANIGLSITHTANSGPLLIENETVLGAITLLDFRLADSDGLQSGLIRRSPNDTLLPETASERYTTGSYTGYCQLRLCQLLSVVSPRHKIMSTAFCTGNVGNILGLYRRVVSFQWFTGLQATPCQTIKSSP
jgi:hypothetical protein